jgi:hypothetical protein
LPNNGKLKQGIEPPSTAIHACSSEWNLADQGDVHALLSAVLPHLKNPAKREQAAEAIDAICTREAQPLKPGRGRTTKCPEWTA